MRHSDSEVIDAARRRIAKVFRVSVDSIKDDYVFGEDLTNSEKSDFKYGELDQILHDVRDVADRQTIKRMNSGQLVIRCVRDYCQHMRSCYQENEREVANTLGI